MKIARFRFFLVVFGALLLAACGGNDSSSEGDHMDDAMDHAHVEAPDEFASLTNPFSNNSEAVEAGETIFQTNCASCHGAEGKGDGAAAASLDPKPANLADSTMMGSLSDGYLFWRVSKGGAMDPFNSAMPAWEAGLTEDQRWQVISYIRTFVDEMDEHMDDDDHGHAEEEDH